MDRAFAKAADDAPIAESHAFRHMVVRQHCDYGLAPAGFADPRSQTRSFLD